MTRRRTSKAPSVRPNLGTFTKARIIEFIWSGDYPAGLTAAKLAAIKLPHQQTALHIAARSGNYPLGTITLGLAGTKTRVGDTAVNEAALLRNDPPGATPSVQIRTANHADITAMDFADLGGHFQPGTTVQDLIDARNGGDTALHIAAQWGHLLPGTTKQHLLSAVASDGHTAWDAVVRTVVHDRRIAMAETIALKHIDAFPELVRELKPASRKFHRKLLGLILTRPELTPDLRRELLANPQTCAVLL